MDNNLFVIEMKKPLQLRAFTIVPERFSVACIPGLASNR
jgi:hypothetical protein